MTFARRRAEWLERKEAERQAQRQALCFPTVKPLHTGSYEGAVSGQAVEKEQPVRSEAYRRLVAARPCIACGASPCQAAHPNTGKGMGMKTDDRLCFPLCPACHAEFDQGAMFDKYERRNIEPLWSFQTRREIIMEGQWPQGLPMLEEEMA